MRISAMAITCFAITLAASPVYRLLLRLAAWFPTLMERKMVECVQHLFREPLGIEYRRNHERA